MAALEIPCPNCGSLLRLPDRSMLGRKGKCGKCTHKFVLVEPEVSLELAQQSGSETIVGVAGQWVSANAPVRTASAPRPQAAYAPPPQPPAPVYTPPPAPAEPVISIPEAEAETGGVARLKAMQRRNAKGKKIKLAIATVVVAGCAAAYFFLMAEDAPKKGKKTAKNKATATATAQASSGNDGSGAGKAGSADSPTQGKPIDLLMVPKGAWIVINLRPAELWQPGGVAEEFRACLGPLGVWIEGMLKTKCLAEPANIEEALICVVDPPAAGPPEISVVVRTKGDFKKSDLLEKFNGEMKNELGRPYYLGEQNAYLILDPRTYAISPSSMADEMVQAADSPTTPVVEIESLLSKTDRSRHFTMVFDPGAVRRQARFLVPENAKTLLDSCLDWFGDDIEGAVVSFHLGEKFFSEILVRNQLVITPPKLQKVLEQQLVTTPQEVLEIVKKTHPQEVGKRKIIGRFPAMTKTFALNSHVSTANRLVSVKTELPDRAGPNLALGALLAWDQTTRPDYGEAANQPASSGPKAKLPDTFAERLQKKISVDFKREFLYAALAILEEETSTKIKIDGNGLKFIGVTQNQYQTVKMDDVPAVAVFDKILTPIKLVLIVDEKNKMITVTSGATAEEKGLTPFPLTPAAK